MKFGKGRHSANPAPPIGAPSPSVVPPGIQIAGAWAWRLLAIAGVLFVFGLLIIELRYIVIPFLIAILISALLQPFVSFLVKHRWPKALAISLAILGALSIVSGLVVLVITQVRTGLPGLQEKTVDAVADLRDYIVSLPLGITQEQLQQWLDQAATALQEDSQVLLNGVLSVGSTAGRVLAGFLLALFATIFLLIDGKSIWQWVVGLFPRRARAAVDGAGLAGWQTLTTFVKVQIFVAAVDAVGIGAFAFFLGLPLAVPIAVAVFLGSFVPVVGAVITGALAVLIALIYNGPAVALIMLAGVLIVQQVEGHVLQPLIMGTAVKVHPLAVVFAVAAGSYVAGIPGALFAVPVVAVLNVMVNYIAAGSWRSAQPALDAGGRSVRA